MIVQFNGVKCRISGTLLKGIKANLEKGQFNIFGGEDVKQPGKRGGKWYRSKETGKVVYGDRPVEKPKKEESENPVKQKTPTASELNEHLKSGGMIQITTHLRSTIYKPQHAGMFVEHGGQLGVKRGKHIDTLSNDNGPMVSIRLSGGKSKPKQADPEKKVEKPKGERLSKNKKMKWFKVEVTSSDYLVFACLEENEKDAKMSVSRTLNPIERITKVSLIDNFKITKDMEPMPRTKMDDGGYWLYLIDKYSSKEKRERIAKTQPSEQPPAPSEKKWEGEKKSKAELEYTPMKISEEEGKLREELNNLRNKIFKKVNGIAKPGNGLRSGYEKYEKRFKEVQAEIEKIQEDRMRAYRQEHVKAQKSISGYVVNLTRLEESMRNHA